ncbi:hypothetical protein BG58_04395 [Caballeronia jiangsuensis]|nr:hypothetical protein BG58_04395 [Caballeronia jiangsuensis]
MVAMGAYLEMEKTDRLVRLNIGAAPEDHGISDWVFMLGDLLYMLIRSNGEISYVHVPLDMEILRRLRESRRGREQGMYRTISGEPTRLAMYLALVFLDRDVPASAISRELGVSEAVMNWLLGVWQCVSGVVDRNNRLELIRLLASDEHE